MITAETRLKLLRETIRDKGLVRLLEAHSGISALVGQKVSFQSGDEPVEFDGFWVSSLTDSASRGLPDVEIVGPDSRIATVNEILEVTSKPIIVDGDTGRSPVEFEHYVRQLERYGVSAVIIEDKTFPKRNSLDPGARQTLEDPEVFAQKIERGKQAGLSGEFMIIARLESLIAGTGMDDALARAKAYVRAGVAGIMIHSKKDRTDEILGFAGAYQRLFEDPETRPLLVCVPTTYNLITDAELSENGFDIVIHANHLLRASYRAMQETALAILANDRSFEAEALWAPTSEIFEVVGFNRVTDQDRQYANEQRLSIIIPAAGKDPVFPELPKSMISVGGKAILDHQIESIRRSGLTNNDVVVVRGHEAGLFSRTDVQYRDNNRYLETRSLDSLFCAEPEMSDGFILVYSDILFNEELIRRLVESGGDIVLLVDSSYRFHEHDVDKRLDLVVGTRRYSSHRRRLQPNVPVDISRIGKGIPKEIADYEFVGMGYFSEEGADIVRKVYRDCRDQSPSPFHEAASFDQAQTTDFLQEIIDRGFTVKGLEVSMGWIEIHNRQDVKVAEEQLGLAKPAVG